MDTGHLAWYFQAQPWTLKPVVHHTFNVAIEMRRAVVDCRSQAVADISGTETLAVAMVMDWMVRYSVRQKHASFA